MSDEMPSGLRAALSGRYEIERELGEGGMARVYLAHDVRHHRRVALKVLRPELAAAVGAERFLSEIRTTANLQHPHILPLFDSGEAGGFLFYVMPYVEGESLRQRLDRERQLPVEDAVQIAKALAQALDHAHRRGVVHRDIKPANILLHEGQPLIADFGIALAASAAGEERLTETGLAVGTLSYMSPEQVLGAEELDGRSDQYSLGAVLYEMLVGAPPHSAATAQAIVAKIVAGHAAPISSTRDLIPANVEAAVRKTMARSPADRFRTTGEFALALSNPAFRLAASPGAPGGSVATGGHWKRLAGAAVGTSMVLLGLALWGWLRPLPRAQVLRYRLGLPPAEALGPLQLGTRLALSPDGRALVYRALGEEGVSLLLRRRDRLDATVLPGTLGASSPFFSPDGSLVAFRLLNGIRVVSVAGGTPVTLAPDVSPLGGGWSPDGYVYIDPWGYGGLVRVPEAGGAVEPASTLDTLAGEVDHLWPVPLPDGSGVLFTVARGEIYSVLESVGGDPGTASWSVAVLDPSTGRHTELVEGVTARLASTGDLVFVTADGTLMAAPFDAERRSLTGEPTPMLEGVGVRALASVDLGLSESGTLVYTTSALGAPYYDLVWVERDGVTRVVEAGWTEIFGAPALSPDGTRLAVSIFRDPLQREDVWVKVLDGGALYKVTHQARRNEFPVWTPDGRSVTFRARSGATYTYQVTRADGSGDPRPVLEESSDIADVRYSADGRWLLYSAESNDDAGRDLWALDLEVGSGPSPLLSRPDRQRFPALSPDGRWLVYASDETGRFEVYVRPFPEVTEARWPVSTEGGHSPVWSQDGRELFYVNGSDALVSVPVPPASTFSPGPEEVLFSTTDLADPLAPAPDGQRFLARRRSSRRDGAELVVVDNWVEELRARSGGIRRP